jgi:putative transposase
MLSPDESAARRLADITSDTAVDRMFGDAQEAGISLPDGADGLIGRLTTKVVEQALVAETDDHLGYEKGDPAGNGSGNSRNGHYGKTVTTCFSSAVTALPGCPTPSRRPAEGDRADLQSGA